MNVTSGIKPSGEMSLKQLELRCTSNTVHYVLNQEHTEDQLFNSNQLKKGATSKQNS